MPLPVEPLGEPPYRGFEIGRIIGLHGYKPAWRSIVPGSQWIEGYIYAHDELDDLILLAKQCIDWRYNEYTLEVQLGRSLTIEDVMAFHKVGEL